MDCRPKEGLAGIAFVRTELSSWTFGREIVELGVTKSILVFSAALARAVILGITVAVLELVRARLERIVERRAALTMGTRVNADEEMTRRKNECEGKNVYC